MIIKVYLEKAYIIYQWICIYLEVNQLICDYLYIYTGQNTNDDVSNMANRNIPEPVGWTEGKIWFTTRKIW